MGWKRYRGSLVTESVGVNELVGKTIVDIKGCEDDSERIIFTCSDGSIYVMYHEQDCCESVSVEDVYGFVRDLIDSPITMAEDVSNEHEDDKHNGDEWYYSYTWTWYKLATAKGYVTIRWYGESNGYYSESVDFVKIHWNKNEPSLRKDIYDEIAAVLD